jgi:plastocyanin
MTHSDTGVLALRNGGRDIMRKPLALLVLILATSALLISGCEDTSYSTGTAYEGEAKASDESGFEPSGELIDGVRVVKVNAQKFEFEPSTIVVNEGEQVRLLITSVDVPHGFALEAYGIDQKLPPNEEQGIDLTASEAGEFPFRCSVFCGLGHKTMRGKLVVKE